MDNIREIKKAEPSDVEKVFMAARKEIEATGTTKVIVILQRPAADHEFSHYMLHTGLLNSEKVALLEITKLHVVDVMNGLKDTSFIP